MMPGGEGQPARRARTAFEQPLRPRLQLLPLPLAIRRQMLVAYEPVGPEICDLDEQLVRSRFRPGRHVYAERWFPQHAEVPAVPENLGEIFHLAKVKPELPA